MDCSDRPSLPLDGVRVVDLTRLLPGPFCTQLLADFGADVIKVEDLGAGDYARWAKPGFAGVDASTRSAFFTALNRNKRSIRVDLKRPEGREVLLALIERADLLLESFRPGVMARLRLDSAVLLARNPRLVICPISGFGQDGPYRERAGHDITYLAAIGLLDLSGEGAGAPTPGAAQIADLGGGALLAAVGALTALRHAERTGKGQVVDISMAHGALSWLGPLAAERFAGADPQRGALPLGGGALCYRVYACADGWVALGALEPKFFSAFCRAAGCPELEAHAFDPPGTPAHAALEAVFAARSAEQWDVFAQETDCCVEVVRRLEDVLDSPLVRDRAMVVELRRPESRHTTPVLGNPIRMSDTPAVHQRRPVPALGEHTDEVLGEIGLDAARIDALHRAGVVAGPEAGAPSSFMR